jgi:CBS domain-containing protein
MREKSPTLSADAPFKDVVRLMDEENVSSVPVVDDGGKFLGMVTEAAVLLKEAYGPDAGAEVGRVERWRNRWEIEKAGATTAADLMTHPSEVRPDGKPWEAAALMYENDALRLPVTQTDGTFVGVITWRDLLQVFLRDDTSIQEEISGRIMGGALLVDPAAVAVTVSDGAVSLKGQVERVDIIEVLLELVRNVPGVVEIDAQLSAPVSPDEDAARAAEFGGSTNLPDKT